MDTTGRYDIGTSSGSLMDALTELQMAMCAEPEVTDGPDAPHKHWVNVGKAVVDEIVRIPEAVPTRRLPTPPATRPRREQELASVPSAPPVPSVVDRIAAMPRYRTTTAIAHPTGAAWLAPTQRQFCERPPV